MTRKRKIVVIVILAVLVPAFSALVLLDAYFSGYQLGKVSMRTVSAGILIDDANYSCRYLLPSGWVPVAKDRKARQWDLNFVSPDKKTLFRAGQRIERTKSRDLPYAIVTYLTRKKRAFAEADIKNVAESVRYLSAAERKRAGVDFGLYGTVTYAVPSKEKPGVTYTTKETILGLRKGKELYFFNHITDISGTEPDKKIPFIDIFLKTLTFY